MTDIRQEKLNFLLALRNLLADYGATIDGVSPADYPDDIEFHFIVHGNNGAVFEGFQIDQLSVAETYDRIYEEEA